MGPHHRAAVGGKCGAGRPQGWGAVWQVRGVGGGILGSIAPIRTAGWPLAARRPPSGSAPSPSFCHNSICKPEFGYKSPGYQLPIWVRVAGAALGADAPLSHAGPCDRSTALATEQLGSRNLCTFSTLSDLCLLMGFKWLARDTADRSHSDTKQPDVRTDHWHHVDKLVG